MRSKVLSRVAALALTASTVLVSVAPASAAWGWHRWGWGWPGAVAAGVVVAATSPLWAPGYYGDYGYYDYYPGYTYAPAPTYGSTVVAQNGDSVAYCQQRFRSYNPSTGMYLGFDGQHHPCP